jgi:hypothetical protein
MLSGPARDRDERRFVPTVDERGFYAISGLQINVVDPCARSGRTAVRPYGGCTFMPKIVDPAPNSSDYPEYIAELPVAPDRPE